MKQRMINTKFWTDSYVVNLDPTEKLLFIYLLTNNLTNISGIYEIQLRQVAFDTGFDVEMVKKILGRFERDEKILYRSGWVAIKNFIKNQNQGSPKVKIGIERELTTAPLELQNFIKYGIDTLSHLTKPNLTKPNLTKPSVEPEIDLREKARLLWISIYLNNAGMVETDFVVELINEYGEKKAKNILYTFRENNFHKIATMKESLSKKGVELKKKTSDLPKTLHWDDMTKRTDQLDIRQNYDYNNATKTFTLRS